MESTSSNNPSIALNFPNLSWLDPYHGIKSRIRQVTEKTIKTELEVQEIKDLKEAFSLSSSYFRPFSGMQEEIAKISFKQMEHFLSKLSEDDDIESILKTYLELVENSELMKLLNIQDEVEVIRTIGMQVTVKGEVLNGAVQKEGKAILNELFSKFVNFIYRLIEIFIAYTGIEALFDEMAPYEQGFYFAEARIKAYADLLATPRVLFEFFSFYTKFYPAISLTTSVLVATPIAIFAYNRYFKKCPTTLDGADNLKETLLANKEPVYARKIILKQIEEAFLAGKGVLLVGKSGCGKSNMVKSLVLEIMQGNICPFLKSAEIFEMGAADLVTLKSPLSFSNLKGRFKDHTDQVVFFFEEFASFFQEGFEGKSGINQIKAFADKFKYVIGATTKKEYESLIKDNETIGARRFVVINLKKIEEEELATMVFHHLHEANPEIELEKGILTYIVKNAVKFSPTTTPVTAAKSLLERAIAKITIPNFSELDKEINELENTSANLTMRFLSEGFLSNLDEINDTIHSKRQEKQDLLKRLETLKKIETAYLKIKHQSYKMARKTVDDSLKRNWLKNEALVKLIGHFIQEKKKSLGLFPMLNKDLIDSIIREKEARDA